MNLNKAIKILRREGAIVNPLKNGKYEVKWPHGYVWEWDTREVIKTARYYTSERSPGYKKSVKHYGKRKNRAATRDALNTEDFDSIPGPTYRVKDEDVWSWD